SPRPPMTAITRPTATRFMETLVLALAAGPHRLHPNAADALGTPPRRELTPTPRLRIPSPPARCGRRRFLHWRRGPTACTPTRLPRWGPRPAANSRRHRASGFPVLRRAVAAGASCTGGGAPPPARTNADASATASLGRRRRMAAGAPVVFIRILPVLPVPPISRPRAVPPGSS